MALAFITTKNGAVWNLDRTFKTEAKFVEEVRAWLLTQEDLDSVVIRDRFTGGYPDIWICMNGQLILVEAKDDEGKPEKLQINFCNRMSKVGAICGICSTLREVVDLVNKARTRMANVNGPGFFDFRE